MIKSLIESPVDCNRSGSRAFNCNKTSNPVLAAPAGPAPLSGLWRPVSSTEERTRKPRSALLGPSKMVCGLQSHVNLMQLQTVEQVQESCLKYNGTLDDMGNPSPLQLVL